MLMDDLKREALDFMDAIHIIRIFIQVHPAIIPFFS